MVWLPFFPLGLSEWVGHPLSPVEEEGVLSQLSFSSLLRISLTILFISFSLISTFVCKVLPETPFVLS